MNSDISSIREEYLLSTLNEESILSNPLQQFEKWFQEAIHADIADVNALTLSTVDKSHKPHSRILLLKGLESGKFIFFTNYESQKGKQIELNQNVSLLFFWKELQRQVRIDGTVAKISEADSIEYFNSRPIESQIGAWASHQSQILENRMELESRFEKLKNDFKGSSIPKPPHWGGYEVNPKSIEFWQGRANRLHDRILFNLINDNTWQMSRLNP